MNHRRRLVLSLITLAVAASVLYIFASLLDPPVDKTRAFPRGTIVVGVDASFPPFASDDGQSVSGLDIDLANAIAKQIDLPIRFVNIGYYGLYDALISGSVDMLISALRIDEARMDDVSYSRHYFDNGLLLVISSREVIASLDSLESKSVAFEFGSPADAQLRVLEERIGRVERLPYELPKYALDSLRLKRADAAIVDATTYMLYQRQQPDWRAAHSYLTHDYYAIALGRRNRDALTLVNDALAALKESGELARIIGTWL